MKQNCLPSSLSGFLDTASFHSNACEFDSQLWLIVGENQDNLSQNDSDSSLVLLQLDGDFEVVKSYPLQVDALPEHYTISGLNLFLYKYKLFVSSTVKCQISGQVKNAVLRMTDMQGFVRFHGFIKVSGKETSQIHPMEIFEEDSSLCGRLIGLPGYKSIRLITFQNFNFEIVKRFWFPSCSPVGQKLEIENVSYIESQLFLVAARLSGRKKIQPDNIHSFYLSDEKSNSVYAIAKDNMRELQEHGGMPSSISILNTEGAGLTLLVRKSDGTMALIRVEKKVLCAKMHSTVIPLVKEIKPAIKPFDFKKIKHYLDRSLPFRAVIYCIAHDVPKRLAPFQAVRHFSSALIALNCKSEALLLLQDNFAEHCSDVRGGIEYLKTLARFELTHEAIEVCRTMLPRFRTNLDLATVYCSLLRSIYAFPEIKLYLDSFPDEFDNEHLLKFKAEMLFAARFYNHSIPYCEKLINLQKPEVELTILELYISAIRESGATGKAMEITNQFIDSQPDLPQIRMQLGLICEDMQNYKSAIEVYGNTQLDGNSLPDVDYNLAHAKLITGDYSGFEEYENRLKIPGLAKRITDITGRQLDSWKGENIPEHMLTVLVTQGRGDTVQFSRFLPDIAQKVKGIRVVCSKDLFEFFQFFNCVDEVIDKQSFNLQTGSHYVAIESLPAVLGVDAEALFDKPYVHVSGKKFGTLFVQKSRPRIGICIQGNPLNGRDHFRSISLAEFSCLLDNDDFEFYFLHKNLNNICNLGKLEEVEHILDCGRYITNIMDTAELIGHMDLVISIDSLTAHLAGAMGREVWVMVCANPHWIYEVDSTCCPWYPSMDIFRQNKLGSWKPVLETVHSRLLERFH